MNYVLINKKPDDVINPIESRMICHCVPLTLEESNAC